MNATGPLPAAEQTGAELIECGVLRSARTMALEKVVWSRFSSEFGPALWVLGALLVGIGLDVRWGRFTLVTGNLIGGLVVGTCAAAGPSTGLTQIDISRHR